MTSPNKVTELDIAPNKTVYVKGFILNANVVNRLEGDELKRAQDFGAKNNVIVPEYPHVSISLRNAEVVPSAGAGQPLTLEELYVQGRFYESKKHPEHNPCHTSRDRGTVMPSVFYNAGSVQPAQFALLDEGSNPHGLEPSAGQEVMLVLNTYATKHTKQGRNVVGLGLRQILLVEPNGPDLAAPVGSGQQGVDVGALAMLGAVSAPAPQQSQPQQQVQAPQQAPYGNNGFNQSQGFPQAGQQPQAAYGDNGFAQGQGSPQAQPQQFAGQQGYSQPQQQYGGSVQPQGQYVPQGDQSQGYPAPQQSQPQQQQGYVQPQPDVNRQAQMTPQQESTSAFEGWPLDVPQPQPQLNNGITYNPQ